MNYPQYDLLKSPRENRPAIKASKLLFLKDYPYERIFLITKLPPTIYRQVLPRWLKARDDADKKIIDRIRTKTISEQAKEFVEVGLDLGLSFLKQAREEGLIKDVKDLKLAMDAVMAMHRVKQLEDGKATSIQVYDSYSPEQMEVYLKTLYLETSKKFPEIMEVPVDGEDYPAEELLGIVSKKDEYN